MRQLINLVVIASSLLGCSSFLYAAQISLGDRQWALLSVPMNVEAQTIESLFADDLPIETFGSEWIIYQFDHASQSYFIPESTDSLKQGDGFWMIQTTGSRVTIDVPDALPPADTSLSQACTSSVGCFQFDLPPYNGAASWALVGAPFSQAINVNDIRVQSSHQPCVNGCSLSDAAGENLLGNNQWVYDSDTFTYQSLNDINSLQPWQAFWVSTRSASASTELSLLLPAPNSDSYLFTEQAKTTLKQRFETDYIAGPGFTADFMQIKDGLDDFMANPFRYRPVFGDAPDVSREGRELHMSALYAYALDDVQVANVVATEILATFQSTDLNDDFWSTTPNYSTDNDLFIQTAKIKKLKDSFYLVKDVQAVLLDSESTFITQWFSDYKDLVWEWAENRFQIYWGHDWQNVGVTSFEPEGLFPIGDPYPLKDSNGNAMTDFGMSWAQDNFNNRIIDNIAYLHSWAVTNDDRVVENFTREYFKNVIKYGTFSDGTYWELIRNVPEDNTRGVFYTNVSLTGLVYMAHVDALNNNFPGDRLYDYKTTDGILNGSTNLTDQPYVGGSTTDGVTEKSIKTLIMGQSKYLRTVADDGWRDLRFNNGASMSTVNKRQNSVLAAVANLYYKDLDLKKYYSYDTAVGYPPKVTIYEGWAGNEDHGAWGNFIIGGAWFDQEQNFFD